VVTARLQRLVPQQAGDAQVTSLLGDAATLVGAYELAMGFCAASLTDLRAQGRLGLVARARATQAWSALHLADLSTAIPAVEEAGRLARETSQPLIWAIARAVESMITAPRGDQDRAEVLAEEAEKAAMPVAANAVLASVQLARGLSALGGGRHADAYEHLYRMHDPADPAFHRGTRWFARGRAHRGRSAQWTTRHRAGDRRGGREAGAQDPVSGLARRPALRACLTR
jgi:hypothetical protein